MLYELFRSNYISGYELDRTIHMMNNGEFMYTIFGNPIINITLKDYNELYNEFLTTLENENY